MVHIGFGVATLAGGGNGGGYYDAPNVVVESKKVVSIDNVL